MKRVLPFAAALLAAACRSSAPGPAPSPSAPASSSAPVAPPSPSPPPAADAAVADASLATDAPVDAARLLPSAPDDMLLVPGGTFTMGQNDGGEMDERPAHLVTVKPFFLDKTEVTQEAYEACVAAKVCSPADQAALDTFHGLFRGAKKPIVGVSWFDAKKYCEWKGKRLPREAEYERAVRGDDGRRYPWGNDPPTHDRTVFETNAPEEVGTHPKGRGPYGHDDLAGNVWEWIDDDYDPFAYTRPTASEGKPGSCEEIVKAQDKLRAENKQGWTGSNPIPTECEKSIRGGAYNYPANGLRSTNRIHHPPKFKLRMTGLRCAKDAG
jgi:formylglycine-generating enzyme required for sulfatase activity